MMRLLLAFLGALGLSQVAVRIGGNVPQTTAAQGSVITLSDIAWRGLIRPQFSGLGNQACDFSTEVGAGFTAKKVGGVNHFFISQNSGASYKSAPCEFSDPAVYDANGNFVSGSQYTQTTSTAPFAPLVTNWGRNADGSQFDFYSTKMGAYYDNSNVLQNLCSGANGCQSWGMHISPDSNSNYLYFTYSAGYGDYSSQSKGGLGLIVMNSADDGSGHRDVSRYGPFIVEGSKGSYPTDPTKTVGIWNAQYLVDMPDHTFGHGSGSSNKLQQNSSPAGPNLSTSSAWPTPSTPSGATDRITSSTNWLHYYNLDGFMNSNGTLPNGQANWAHRFTETYPYVFEGAGTQGAMEAIDPLQNSGVGTWNETSYVGTAIVIKTATKHGFLAFASTSTNHQSGNVTGCTHSHVWYCASCGNVCPLHSCTDLYVNQGPVTTHQEARWLIYDFNGAMTNVKNGSTTDYTVNPSSTIFPQFDISASLPMAGQGFALAPFMVGGAYYDTGTNMLYVLLWASDSTTNPGENRPLIAAFHIAQ